MNNHWVGRAAVASLWLSVLAGPAAAAEFKIDQQRTLLVVKTFKEGAAARLAHNHVVHAQDYSGTVSFDPAEPAKASIRLEVQTSTLTVDDFVRRKQFGESGLPSDDDLADINKNMRSAEQLNVARFPTMSFVSTKIEKTGEGEYKVTGKLTIRGVTREVTFPAAVAIEGGAFHGKGSFRFKQSSFGWKPYSAFFGAVKVADEVQMFVDIVGTPL